MFNIGIVRGGDLAADALIYRPPDANLVNYLTANLQRAGELVGSYSNTFINTMTDVYNRFASDTARLYQKLVLQDASGHLNQDMVSVVRYEHLHMANLAMQRYILAEPSLNSLYQKGMCYGYQDTCVMYEENKYGEDCVEYRRVMDGSLIFDDDDEGSVITYSQNDTEMYKEDLDTIDQFNIMKTWENVARMVAEGIDPSDPLLGEL